MFFVIQGNKYQGNGLFFTLAGDVGGNQAIFLGTWLFDVGVCIFFTYGAGLQLLFCTWLPGPFLLKYGWLHTAPR